MRVITPIDITDTSLVSSTVMEPTPDIDPALWISGRGYAIGELVYSEDSHKIYSALVVITGGSAASLVSPVIDVELAIPKWVEIGSTNRWNMFDVYRNTSTVIEDTLATIVIGTTITAEELEEADPYYDKVVLLLQNITSLPPIDYSSTPKVPVAVVTENLAIPAGPAVDLALDNSFMDGPSIMFTSGYIHYADSNDWWMEDKDFTVEVELKFLPEAAGSRCGIIGQNASNGGDTSWYISKNTGNYLTTGITSGGTIYGFISLYPVSVNVKLEIVIQRRANFLEMYCNNVFYGSIPVAGSMINVPYKLGIGTIGEYNDIYGGGYGTTMIGAIKTVRITKGVARYPAAGPAITLFPLDGKTLAILNIENVGSITVTSSYNSGDMNYTPIATNTYYMNTRNVFDWWTYFTTQFIPKKSLVIHNLPSGYPDTRISITFNGSSPMSIGTCIIGKSTVIGRLQHGAELDVLNFSTMERDTFGNATLVPRREVSTLNATLYVDKNIFEDVQSIKEDLDAKPAVWIGIDSPTDPYYYSLIFLGIYRDFNFQLDNPIGPTISLEVEEL